MSKEIKFVYPEDELVKLTKEDVGTTLYCNSFYNGKKMGGLLVVCNKSLNKKLNLSFDKASLYFTDFVFRMFKIEQSFFEEYLFEFAMLLEGEKENIKLHLDPTIKGFRLFCEQTIKHKSFRIMFYNVEDRKLQVVYLKLKDDEDLDFLERNLAISKKNIYNYFSKKIMNLNQFSDFIKQKSPETSTYFIQNNKIVFLDIFRVRNGAK